MDFSSFKELLLRKTDDESLKTLIKVIDGNVLADRIIESLEKMATSPKKVSKVANEAIKDFATRMDPQNGPELLREALGHHASRYKAALDAGDKKMANHHASTFFKTMDLVHHLEPLTHGKLQSDLIDIKPWERTHPSRTETFADKIARDPEYAKNNPVTRGKKKLHHFRIDTEGFSFRPKGNDWSFLQNDPDTIQYGKEISRHGHIGAYPMEHNKINGKYIPIESVENIYDGKMNHPFDSHPIFGHFKQPSEERTDGARDAEYSAQRKQFERLGLDAHDARMQELKDSGAYEARGLKPGLQIHPTSRRQEAGKTITPTSSEPALPEYLKDLAQPAHPAVTQTAAQPSTKVITRKMSDKDKAKAILPPHLHDLLKD
jgi:hypothetical protein